MKGAVLFDLYDAVALSFLQGLIGVGGIAHLE